MTIIEAAKLARRWMAHWMKNEECDCEDGHICGRRERERELEEIDKAIKAEQDGPCDSKTRELVLQNRLLKESIWKHKHIKHERTICPLSVGTTERCCEIIMRDAGLNPENGEFVEKQECICGGERNKVPHAINCLFYIEKRVVSRTNLEQYLAVSMQMLMARADGRNEDPYLDKLDGLGERLTQEEKDFCDEMGKDWAKK